MIGVVGLVARVALLAQVVSGESVKVLTGSTFDSTVKSSEIWLLKFCAHECPNLE